MAPVDALTLQQELHVRFRELRFGQLSFADYCFRVDEGDETATIETDEFTVLVEIRPGNAYVTVEAKFLIDDAPPETVEGILNLQLVLVTGDKWVQTDPFDDVSEPYATLEFDKEDTNLTSFLMITVMEEEEQSSE